MIGGIRESFSRLRPVARASVWRSSLSVDSSCEGIFAFWHRLTKKRHACACCTRYSLRRLSVDLSDLSEVPCATKVEIGRVLK